jgi:hydroxyacylglutathione hydrolase
MILERSMQSNWLSNAYLLGDEQDGTGVVIDSGGPSEPLLEAAERHGLEVGLLLLTHHHHDHVAENHVWREHHGVEILAHPLEAEHLLDVDRTIEPGEKIEAGGLVIEPLHTPGHTAGMLSFVVAVGGRAPGSSRQGPGSCAADVFTGDTLFKGSVGGVRAPGSTGFEDLRHSIMDVLMALPHDTRVRPGHTDPTTIGDEWERNAFVRLWRGLDEEGDERCRVGDEPARLVLWAPDYDGGHKAWVRWEDGRDDIVPGSAVSRD